LEEFLYYLFKDIVAEFGNRTLLGKSHAFKDIFFVAPNYQGMVATPNARIETKDHDFVIGIRVQAILSNEDASASLEGIQPNTEAQQNSELETHTLDVPAVAIECKTYIDKTMLEGAATAATQLKARNPNSLYIVLAEWVKLSDDINLQKYSAIDRTYILRKQKNTDREYRFAPTYVKNPIYADTVNSLFDFVRDHLTSDWEGGIEFGLQRGWL
jgi:hypothetical protein